FASIRSDRGPPASPAGRRSGQESVRKGCASSPRSWMHAPGHAGPAQFPWPARGQPIRLIGGAPPAATAGLLSRPSGGPGPMTTIDEVMADGWRAFQAGDMERAERAYRLVLTQAPATARAWFMLGATLQMRGRLEEAVASYRQAVRL